MNDKRHDDLHEVRSHLHDLHFRTEGLDQLLEEITVLACDVVGGDTSGGVTVIRGDRPATIAASDERTLKIDEIQYGQGAGPCLDCARSGEPMNVYDLETDTRWPDYQKHALQHGLRSSLSLPLALGPVAVGALNLYVFEQHGFGDTERAVLGQFCEEASRAISLALRHDAVTQQNDHLHTAMASRRLIDQAIGIVMAQNRCSSDDAFAILRQASQNRNVKVRDLAATVIRSISGSDPSPETHFKR
jgi:GAF domain-containing protein